MGFFVRLKKEAWKVLRFFLIIAVLIAGGIYLARYLKQEIRPDHFKVFIDSDSANEIDDLFAIAAAIIEPRMELLALSSAQWHAHPEAPDSSVAASQAINKELLRLFRRSYTPHPMGANKPCSYWGDPIPQSSPAAQLIISEARSLPEGEKLNVVTLGSATNLASAILTDTSLVKKISWYAMGYRYDARQGIWNKNEFNVRNDLDAMDYLLNLEELETHIMTASTCESFRFSRQEVWDNLVNQGEEWAYLTERWMKVCPNDTERTMWDLALIQAILYPDLAHSKLVLTPPENTRRRITVYTQIDAERMKKAYFTAIRKYNNKR